jgi:CheY-like chemotaxis protein/curved DNA-binding protein CbpA
VPRILLAEGHPATRELVHRTLADAGFEVLEAEDPRTAYELYAARRPDVVVLGVDFGTGDGAALARRLRDADPRVLLVVADREHLGKARGLPAVLPLKANAYVADPTRRELVEKIQQLLSQSRARRPKGAALVLSREPSARGEVKVGVVARLLHQVWRSLSEGILVLEEAGVERQIFFLRGVPVAAQSGEANESLVRWLAASSGLEDRAREAALEAMAGGLSAGAALIAAGVIEPGEPLRATLRAHLKTQVVRAVAAREGRWRFHAGGEFAPEVQAVEVLPLQAILEGARTGIPTKHFSDALRAVTDAFPARTGDFQQVLPAAGLGSSDLRLALALDGRTATRAYLEARRAELKDALSLLWFLSMLGAVAFHETPEGPGGPYGGARPALRRRKPLPADRAEAVRQAALQILPGTYFHALGVDVAANGAEVDRAYQEVASRFHPDGFAEYEVGDLQDLLAAVQDKVSAAYRVLGNAEKRRAYLSFLLLRFELTGARRPGIDVDAEVALKRGERALRARRNAEAASELRDATEQNPKEPEYLAMLGFAELFDPVLPPSERAHQAKRQARRALALAPEHPRASAVLALAEERLGDVAEARRVVLGALRAHPGSELLRQVLHRLNTPRASPAPPP